MPDDPRRYRRRGQPLAVDDVLAVHDQQRLEVGHGTVLERQPLHEQGLAPLDAVLLAAGFHDRVHGGWVRCCAAGAHSEVAAEADSALAPERRRPPLRPRRRGFDCRPSSSPPESPPPAAPAPPCSPPAAPRESPPAGAPAAPPESAPAAPPATPAEAPPRAPAPRRRRTAAVDLDSGSRAGGASTSVATASVRPACSIRTRCFSPTYGPPPVIEIM